MNSFECIQKDQKHVVLNWIERVQQWTPSERVLRATTLKETSESVHRFFWRFKTCIVPGATDKDKKPYSNTCTITTKAYCKLDRAHYHGGGPPSLFHFDCLVFLFSSFYFSRYFIISVSLSLRLMSSRCLLKLVLFLAFVFPSTRHSSFSCLVLFFCFLLLSCLASVLSCFTLWTFML